jgi:hypothetical protein
MAPDPAGKDDDGPALAGLCRRGAIFADVATCAQTPSRSARLPRSALDIGGHRGEDRAMSDDEAAVRERIVTAIDAYLSLLRDGAERQPTLSDLARALDDLVMVYHDTPDVGPDSDELGERVEERPLREQASRAFPELGMYALVEPEGGPDQQCGMSDAIDDLAEIAVDLTEILWLFEHRSHNDAVWEFRLGYQSHWGRHLHELRIYLHALAAW